MTCSFVNPDLVRAPRFLRHGLAILVVGTLAWSPPCTAQVGLVSLAQSTAQSGLATLDWPAPDADVSTYTTVYQCQFASDRVEARGQEVLDIRDTVAIGPSDVLGQLPPAVIDVARRCSAKFAPDAVPLSQYEHWVKLYLRAGRDADAKLVARRRLDAANGSIKRTRPESDAPEIRSVAPNVRERAEVLRTLVLTFLSASPARFDAAVPYLREVQAMGNASPWLARLQVSAALFMVARVAEDTTLTRQGAEWMLDVAQHLDETQRQSQQYQSVTGALMMAQRALTHDTGLDSLRKSTAAYIALQRTLQKEIERHDDLIGAPAKPIGGDFWFPKKPDTVVPMPGRVTVLLAVGGPELASRELGAMLRRWKTKFPAVEIVYATNTRGFFRGMVPPPPDTEAWYRRRMIQDFYNYPATVSVTNTKFWHLPNPDRRRIDQQTDNQANYGGRLWLFDQSGTIIHYGMPERGNEKDFTELIDVLVHRQ